MKYSYLVALLFSTCYSAYAQTFIRSELNTQLNTPWEITYGPDNFLWITEKEGKVARVNPLTGSKTIVFTATDYFPGSDLEDLQACTNPSIGSGTLGLALDPDFTEAANAYIYFVYSYNSGILEPATKFRIKRLTWNAASNTVVSDTNIVDLISSGHAHLGGRLLAVKQNGTSYLYLTIGDHGPSEFSGPDCYNPQSTNPNNFTQDITTQNGKIHRFNIDGSIPTDNPVVGNSFFTRGHRNPQGLMYNPNLDIVYDIEHGDFTDDEINILYKGMNYGWKNVRGYHDDENFAGEATYVANYTPNPSILNDSLVEPLYSWCTETPDTSDSTNNYVWCTVAPSDGVYYGSDAIPQWTNSLLAVTLKDGLTMDREVYQFKLLEDGSLALSTENHPNPQKFFGEDQALNGRLRDIAISNDGLRIFLINNGGMDSDKITVYTYDTTDTGINENDGKHILAYPNPVETILNLEGLEYIQDFKSLFISNIAGSAIIRIDEAQSSIDVSGLAPGVYTITLVGTQQMFNIRFVKK